jgi:hypothetical protein
VDARRITAFPALADLPTAETAELAAALSEVNAEPGIDGVTVDDHRTAVCFSEQSEAEVLIDDGERSRKRFPAVDLNRFC